MTLRRVHPPSVPLHIPEAAVTTPISCWMCDGPMRLEATLDWTAWYHCTCGNYECRRILQDEPTTETA